MSLVAAKIDGNVQNSTKTNAILKKIGFQPVHRPCWQISDVNSACPRDRKWSNIPQKSWPRDTSESSRTLMLAKIVVPGFSRQAPPFNKEPPFAVTLLRLEHSWISAQWRR